MIAGYQDYTLRFKSLVPEVYVGCHYCRWDSGPYRTDAEALDAAEEHIEKGHDGIRDSRCGKCGGVGDLDVVEDSRDEDATGTEECPDCHGSGWLAEASEGERA